VSYRLACDEQTRAMRLRSTNPPTLHRALNWLAEHEYARSDEIAKDLKVRRSDVDRELGAALQAGTVQRGPSGRRDKRTTHPRQSLETQQPTGPDPRP
jgi:DNA-binding MarR family transcriptional regulator